MKNYTTLIFIRFLCTSSFGESQEATIEKAVPNSIKVTSCINNETAENTSTQSYRPKNGYVPNEETAIKIAIAVWEPIYGKNKITSEKPYKVNLKNGV
ncbi:MAG TPA: NTF2 fold immunity protein [Cellvibrionaceae bacterium]